MCVCVCVCVCVLYMCVSWGGVACTCALFKATNDREGARELERDRDRQRQRQTETDRNRVRGRETETDRDTERARDRDREDSKQLRCIPFHIHRIPAGITSRRAILAVSGRCVSIKVGASAHLAQVSHRSQDEMQNSAMWEFAFGNIHVAFYRELSAHRIKGPRKAGFVCKGTLKIDTVIKVLCIPTAFLGPLILRFLRS